MILECNLKKIIVIGLSSLDFLISICSCIPLYNRPEPFSQKLYGERKDQYGNLVSYIEQRETKNNIFWLMSTEGPGWHPWITISYHLVTLGKGSHKLSHIKGFMQENVFLTNFLPVQDTELWLAFEILDVKRDEVEIRMILFNENKVMDKQKIPYCIRFNIQDFYEVRGYGIKLSYDNKQIEFQTTIGIVKYIVENDRLMKKNNS